jgi:DnaJ-class molecular chaperone
VELVTLDFVFKFVGTAGGVEARQEAPMKTCPDCNGDGVVEKGTDDEQRCPTCGGSGFVADDDDNNEEVIRTSR